MGDFSLELKMESIVDVRSRAYFREVFTSYASGNYRSATVMLWAVVVCDLLFKLEEMKSVYQDKIAEEVLERLKKSQAAQPDSPRWELELLDLVHARTQLLEDHEHRSLQELQRHRHLAAHPILKQNYELLTPTPEATRADMRVALESVLTKPALMTKQVFHTLTEDLERSKDLFPDDAQLRRYLEAKYFAKAIPAVIREIFLSLWSVTFNSLDVRAAACREIFVRALEFMFDRDTLARLSEIEAKQGRFSRLEPALLKHAVGFLCTRPAAFAKLNDEGKALLRSYWQKKPAELLAGFGCSEGFSGQLDELARMRSLNWLDVEWGNFDAWLKILDENDLRDRVLGVLVDAHARSHTFDEADYTFDLLKHAKNRVLTSDELLRLMNGFENNIELYKRRGAAVECRVLQRWIEETWGAEFDASGFTTYFGLAPPTSYDGPPPSEGRPE